MKKGVKIAIIVGVIVLVIAIAGGYFFINDVAQKAKIIEEMEQIDELTSSGDFELEALKEKTSTIVTTGKYASVEKAVKNYANDLFNTAFEIKNLMENEKMANLLTAANYKEDGPEFTESKNYLSETKKQLQDNREKMLSYLEESKINSYVEAETTDEYCINLYKELITEDLKMVDAERNELEESINKVVSLLDTADEVFNFLIANKGKWQVQGNQIAFATNDLIQTYNDLLTKLQ